MTDINENIEVIRKFAEARDWGQFHTPKNLAMAISGEAGELAAEFQWLTPEESINLSEAKRDQVASEMADVAIYLLRLSDVLSVDLNKAIEIKMEINEDRFPEIK